MKFYLPLAAVLLASPALAQTTTTRISPQTALAQPVVRALIATKDGQFQALVQDTQSDEITLRMQIAEQADQITQLKAQIAAETPKTTPKPSQPK